MSQQQEATIAVAQVVADTDGTECPHEGVEGRHGLGAVEGLDAGGEDLCPVARAFLVAGDAAPSVFVPGDSETGGVVDEVRGAAVFVPGCVAVTPAVGAQGERDAAVFGCAVA
jgi:hypothetical protein